MLLKFNIIWVITGIHCACSLPDPSAFTSSFSNIFSCYLKWQIKIYFQDSFILRIKTVFFIDNSMNRNDFFFTLYQMFQRPFPHHFHLLILGRLATSHVKLHTLENWNQTLSHPKKNLNPYQKWRFTVTTCTWQTRLFPQAPFKNRVLDLYKLQSYMLWEKIMIQKLL